MTCIWIAFICSTDEIGGNDTQAKLSSSASWTGQAQASEEGKSYALFLTRVFTVLCIYNQEKLIQNSM